MQVCCVEGCEGPDVADPVFFEFPTSRLQRKRWTDALNASRIPQDALICIRHFTSKDYELVRGKPRLKRRVVPKMTVGDKPNNEDTEESQESTDTATSDPTSCTNDENTQVVTNNENNHNGINDLGEKVKSDNNKTHDDNDNGHNNNGNSHNDTAKDNDITSVTKKDRSRSREKNTKTEKHDNDNGKINNDNFGNDHVKDNKDRGKIDNDNGKVNNDRAKVNNVSGKEDNNEEVNSDTAKVDNDNGKVNHDSATVDNENGKVNNDSEKVDNDIGKDNKRTVNNGKVHNRKTRCKITAERRVRRGRSYMDSDSSPDSVSSSPPPPPPPEIEGSKEDIEGILTNYYIENKKTERQVAAMTDVLQEETRGDWRGVGRRDVEEEFRGFEVNEPVYIELSVGQGYPRYPGNGSQAPGENDCLMVLESVQCDVDPALLLAAREDEEVEQVDLAGDDDDDEPVLLPKKKEDPISLLTSSDEDDVIIQEPKIDTVEVSSGVTSEDDVPLVKLVKKTKRKKTSNTKKNNVITKLLWGGTDFYCVHCRFTTVSSSEYTKHMATHTTGKVLQVCQDCNFTTSSKGQLYRHRQKHKSERRFQCQKCSYSAKHKMSLVYHMKTHGNFQDVEIAICGTFEPTSKVSRLSEKSKAKERDKRYKCDMCDFYKTDRFSDMRRHRKRKHKVDTDDDDDDYAP